jgi:hypothetical protein
MRKVLAALALAVAALPLCAVAQTDTNGQIVRAPPGAPLINSTSGANSGSTSTSTSGAAAGANSSSSTSQQQGQNQQQQTQQGQQQGQDLRNTNNNRNNNNLSQGQDASNQNQIGQSITFNSSTPETTTSNINYSGTTTQRNAPAVVGPVMNPTTPCLATIAAGASVVGFGISLGGGLEDKECTRREFARSLSAIGHNDAALAVLCGNESVKAAASVLCNRVATVMAGKPDPDPKGASVATPAAPAGAARGPVNGQIERGSDGKSYRYTEGSGWQPVSMEEVTTRPLVRTSFH